MRAEDSARVFYNDMCSGGWALPAETACPECGATSEGPCAIDAESIFPVTREPFGMQQIGQGDLFA